MDSFLDSRRLLKGPRQAFERDIARLLVVNAFDEVRLVTGEGEKSADVLGVKGGKLWAIRCAFTGNQPPPVSAVDSVVEAGRFHKADRLLVASSRPFGPDTAARVDRWAMLGLRIELLPPSTLLEMACQSPEYPRSRRSLRDYQEEAVTAFMDALRQTGRGQVVLATGLGKTVVMAEMVARLLREGAIPGGRALVMAGTRDLVDQLQRAFWTQLPKWAPTHRLVGGEEPSFWKGVTFATAQSVMARLDRLPSFGLVLIDEAHHVGSESFRMVIEKLNPPMLGGVTATPWRGDGYVIDQLLGIPVYQVGIADGLRRGFLCEADYRLLADNIDWTFVRKRSAHQYSIKQLNKRLLIPTRDEEAAKVIRATFDAQKRCAAIVFCATVTHARAFAGMLRLFGLVAEAITGDMPSRERDRTMSAFRQGRLQVVTTRDLFNEGVDVPDVDMVVFMRVTHSRRIFVQQLGRGLRISPGKSKVVVLDFVSDLRRVAEVIELERVAHGDVEILSMPEHLIQFRDAGAGEFMLKWMREQADLFNREGDAHLELPVLDPPDPARMGGAQ